MKLKKILLGRAATLIDGSGEIYNLEHRSKKKIPTNKILVGKYATPDTAIFFPNSAGAVFETGGIACHAAILAREFGIPCIVGVTGLLDSIKIDDYIVLNSLNGEVFIYENE